MFIIELIDRMKNRFEHPYLFAFHMAIFYVLAEINNYRLRHTGGPVFREWESGFSDVNIYNTLLVVVWVLLARDFYEFIIKFYCDIKVALSEKD